MKKIKNTNRILSILFLMLLMSCVQDDDFSVPSPLNQEENEALIDIQKGIEEGVITEISIEALKQQFVAGEVVQFSSNSVVKGYVSSSDKTGNFYKEIYIQDQPSNPKAAINIVLNQVDSYNQFNLGREVYISLKDLYLGETVSEVLAIGGFEDGSRVGLLTENQIKSHLFRSSETVEIEPLELNFSDINENYIGMFIVINNVEFPENLKDQSYFNAIDDFDTQRTMQRCEGFSYEEFILETSSFSSFKNEILPTQNGTIKGVISKSYGGDNFVLVLNDTKDVVMTDSRCSPLNADDFTVIFEETFNDAIDNETLDTEGWINFSERGQVLWTEQIYSKNGYAEFGTFGANDTANVGWLISPGIDMDVYLNEFLNFKMGQHHLDSVRNKIEVLASTDFNGTDVLNATWTVINAKVPTKYDEWYAFKDSGLVDISEYTGTLYVAFKVTGSGTNEALDGSYQLDDFRVLTEK
ncbi:DUF5689 domain-containing protein [Formosa sp. PL04]|uniref:DUF5689 domain-containing protein n=1 Tax=Formosa sp. PL04 TaxID=3081755 RepID=UPI00298184B1|nr:DUF5689 domain-containing protein [Formosa sp. PL04]MDW5289962.1 DUF5689 domain-containing protein [Formosa sp. PL04]